MATYKELDTYLQYEQPTKYIVNTQDYSDEYSIPVLTAGKTFILGYTNEIEGIFQASQEPVIIFDDFTSSIQYVNFDFKVKSSAMKILHKINEEDNLKYLFYAMKCLKFTPFSHKRLWISEYSKLKIQHRSSQEQNKIASELNNIEQGIKVKQEQLKALDELIQSRFMQSFEYNKLHRLGTLYTLSQLCKVSSSKRIYQKEQKSSGIPFFRVADLVSKIETNNANAELFISISMYQELKKQGYVPSEGDILVTTRGTLGKCYIVSKKDDFYFQDGMISWLKDFSSQISSRYLAYAFAMPQIQNQIKSIQGKGATVSFLSLAMLKQLEILVPPIEQQKKFLEFVQQVESAKEIVKIQIKDLQELLALKMDEYFK